MDRNEFEEIMEGDSQLSKYIDQDNIFLGLQIIIKYLPNSGIEGAEHDVVYSAYVGDVLEAGITKEDATELRKLNWMIDEDSLACFV